MAHAHRAHPEDESVARRLQELELRLDALAAEHQAWGRRPPTIAAVARSRREHLELSALARTLRIELEGRTP